ncbi:unnamed protein product [Meganyctiphanes norvegica]|uniref:Sema domain-containing protein n=1 Tax=Meganyctiphanes norvegica TaxID=48144 RepID=A0AAV2S794_MEGNR
MCFNKGKSEDDCQNYIRVLVKEDNEVFLICGTNAYKPLCRQYSQQENGNWEFTESSGIGKCPFDPRHNSTYVFTDGSLYSGTVADFQGVTPLIFRETLKTDHNDYKQLNDPNFVHSFSFGEYVYFFFRETATEYMNCGKRVYSRIARVCKDDKGGISNRFEKSWTSFLKSRLNCSVPGDYPYYFDEIQSLSKVISGVYGGQEETLVYAVFTTPSNSIPGSAICAFSMQDITKAFTGSFKEQENLNSNWLPVHYTKLPSVRPGLCLNDSRSLPLDNINFIMGHPLMDQSVPAFHGQPLFMKTTFDYRFSYIAVDPQVPLVDGNKLDVIFIATDSGIILKAINAYSSLSNSEVEAVIVEEIYAVSAPIVNLQLVKAKNGSSSSLIIITDKEVTSISLHRCSVADSCLN